MMHVDRFIESNLPGVQRENNNLDLDIVDGHLVVMWEGGRELDRIPLEGFEVLKIPAELVPQEWSSEWRLADEWQVVVVTPQEALRLRMAYECWRLAVSYARGQKLDELAKIWPYT